MLVAVIAAGIAFAAFVPSALVFIIAIVQRQAYLDAPVNSLAEQNAYSALESAVSISALLALLGLVALLAFTVLLIVWTYGAYRFVESSSAEGRTWSRGWAVSSWLIPVANAILPFLVLSEVDRIVRAWGRGAVHEWKRTPLSAWFIVWSALFISSFAIQVGAVGLQLFGFDEVVPWISAINVLTYSASLVPAVGFILITDSAIRAIVTSPQQLAAGQGWALTAP